jgi:hypothetical protein
MKHLSFLLLASVLQASELSGRVIGDRGSAVPGSYVWLLREAAPNEDIKKVAPEARSMVVDPNGYFGFFGLKPGRYRICAEPRHVGYWGNCQWGDAAIVDLYGTEPRQVSVLVGLAVKIRVIIDDVNEIRSKAKDDEKDPIGFRVLAVQEKRTPVHLVLVKDEAKQAVYEALVPGDRSLKVSVSSDRAKFVESAKEGVEAESKDKEYNVLANDTKSREIVLKLKSLEKVIRDVKK